MKKDLLVALLCLLSAPLSQGAEPALQNARPVRAGGAEGLAPLSFGMTYSNRPRGYAYLTSQEYPDIFVLISSGLPGVRGIYRCGYDGKNADGSLVYKKPVQVGHPWGTKLPPSRFRVFQREGETYSLWLSPKKLTVTRWDDAQQAFVKVTESPWQGIEKPIGSFDVIPRGNRDLELVLLCSDGSSYRPETFKGDRQSYYDGAGIYRGELPRYGVFRFTVDARNWQQVSEVEQVSPDMNVVVGGSEIAAVCGPDGTPDGYLVTGLLGSMKFLPRTRGESPVHHVWKDERNILVHPAYSSRVIPFGGPDKVRDELIIGGESALYHYEYAGTRADGSPVYTEPKPILQRGADLYSGSLTVPCVTDWDGDGVLDIVAGNSEGRLLFFKNNGTDREPDFNGLPEQIEAGGKPILLRPGYHIVQGPFEGAWGYLCPAVFDWNGDGLPDVIVSGSRAKFEVMLNRGTRTAPRLDPPVPLRFDNMELWGTWRVRPAMARIDGRNVIVIMDDDNALHLYRQVDDFNVEDGGKLRLTDGRPITGHNARQEGLGQWGRGKLHFVDWDSDGKLDLLVGSIKRSSYPSPERGLPCTRFERKEIGMQVMLLRNAGTNREMKFEEPVQFQVDGKDFYMGAHSNAPVPCLLGDTSGGANLLVGVESGKFFFFEHGHLTTVGIDGQQGGSR